MRRRKYYKTDRRGPIICMLITAFIFMLSVGYAALNEDLTISGEAHFRVEADIRITDVSLYTTTYSALEDYNPSFGKDSMKVGITLPSNNSSVTYKVTVTNYGNVAMQLKSITKEIENNNYNITFNKALPLTIGKTSSEEIEMTFKNNTNVSQTINANILFTFAKEEAVMASGNSAAATSTFYNGPLTKDSIESITFMPTKEIPEDAVGYWDASEVQGTNKVMAYYLNSETEGMYDLYIAADGEVYAPVSSNYLFENFTSVTSINFNNSFNTEKSTSMTRMFQNCKLLTNLNLSNFDTSNTTDILMFSGCSNLENINLSGWENNKITSMVSMFNGLSKLKTLNLTKFKTDNVRNMRQMFQGCTLLQELDLSSFNTENVTNMQLMFYNCSSLTNLNISIFNTKNVTTISSNNHGMFENCSSLKELDLSNFDTSNVTSMFYMFSGCKALTELNLANFDTSNVTNMSQMFRNCSNLAMLDLSSFNTTNVTNMSSMFQGCSSLASINTSNFITSNVTSMEQMFQECSSLTNLNISNFDISSLTNANLMFYKCSKLKNLDIRTMDFENKTITTNRIFENVASGVNIYVLNEYNKTFIEGLKSNANVIIYVSPEEEVEEG